MGLLPDFFDDAVRRWPQRVAVDIPPGPDRPQRILSTYAQLDADVRVLASHLREVIHGEQVVGILLPRTTPQFFSAQLAVHKAGAAWTCLEPAFPDERLRQILEDVEVKILLTDDAGRARMRGAGSSGVVVLNVHELLASRTRAQPAGAAEAAPAWLTSASLAYVIHTSGTTGQPKGVMIEHHSIVNLVTSDLQAFGLTPDARVAQGSSAAYDSSVEETWLAFAAGAALVVMDDDAARLGPDLIAWLRQERITVFCPPPTLLRATGCMDPANELPDLKLLYVGGEPLPGDLADRWSRGRILVNGYGPTECTVTCLRGRVHAGESISIGKPVQGASAWVLDGGGQQVAPGEQGELWIGGVGVARGYWNRPALTAERFVDHPRLGRLYRTGDLVHCDEAGQHFYHGRMDSQVKVRGHRIELCEIESRLAGLPGVRAAACRVQASGEAGIVAFVVPENEKNPPALAELKAALARVLPAHMVPGRIGFLEALPTGVGGKLDRSALPELPAASSQQQSIVTPRNAMEVRLAVAFQQVLQPGGPVSIHGDFFDEFGGDSLKAAMLVTLLRQDAATASVTVRDVYAARTVAVLATIARPVNMASTPARDRPDSGGSPFLVTLVQTAWLTAVLAVASVASWWVAFRGLPLLANSEGLVLTLLLAPLLLIAVIVVYVPLSLLISVAVKRLLVGRYRALRAPVWSGFHLRHWIVQQAVRMVPWSLLTGTGLQAVALRALGARIGRRVHIHRGVDLQQGGWDLLEIGDDVTLCQSAAVRLVELEAGQVVIGPVTLGEGSTLDTRAGVASHTVIGRGAWLTALSSLPAGTQIPRDEIWSGIPARRIGPAPTPPALTQDSPAWSPWRYGITLSLVRAGIPLLLLLPFETVNILACAVLDLSPAGVGNWFIHDSAGWKAWTCGVALELLLVPVTLAWMAVLIRVLGRVQQGTVCRFSAAYLRVWLKPGLVEGAGNWLSGTLFWPLWLRWAGMKVGRGCEISSIHDVVPELIDIGAECFLADGVYLGGARVQQGRVTLAATALGRNTFIGNHVVIAAGRQLPEDVLLGIATPASEAPVRAGSSWFGHPPFELPRREVVQADRSLTHEPSAVRYGNRVFWEALRFALPAMPLLVLVAWFRVLDAAEVAFAALPFLMLIVPAVTFGATASLCLTVIALKWGLLGRVRPGQHALWSCWCSRWDFLYVAWGQYTRSALVRIEGTLLLHWFLRAMGMKIGRRVVLGPGFAQVVDPDMLKIGEGATVNAMFQAHTFEDRVLKIQPIVVSPGATLGSATVPLYGCRIGEGAHVAAHSVIMKGERLTPGLRYEGAPTHNN